MLVYTRILPGTGTEITDAAVLSGTSQETSSTLSDYVSKMRYNFRTGTIFRERLDQENDTYEVYI